MHVYSRIFDINLSGEIMNNIIIMNFMNSHEAKF